MTLLPAGIAGAPFAWIAMHLIGVARESRAVPDSLLAGLFVAFAFGTPLRFLATDFVTSGTGGSSLVSALNNGANLVIGSGILCLAAFTLRVFRAWSPWAKGFASSIGAALLLVSASAMRSDFPAHGSSLWAIAFDAICGLSFAWAFAECLLHYRKLRRRLRVGIGEPVVANRFLLWSLWTGAIGALAIELVLLRPGLAWSGAGAILGVGGVPDGPWLGLIRVAKASVLIAAPIVAVSVWLSFTPPDRYRRWVAARSSLRAG